MDCPPIPPERPDFYTVLGLDQNATAEEICAAHKALQRKFHPSSRLRGSEPDEEKFKQVGVAFDVLGDAQMRAKYDKVYYRVRACWNAYEVNLHHWNKKMKDDEERRARIDALRQKRAANMLRKKKEEEERRAAQMRQQQLEQQQEATRREQERLKKEWEEAQAEVQRKKEWQERRLNEVEPSNEKTSSDKEEPSLRERWKTAQDRTQEQAKRAEEANIRAAKERLRRQQEDEDEQRAATEEEQQAESSTKQPTEEHSTEDETQPAAHKANQESLAEKQRAAEERERRVLEQYRLEQADAAEKRLQDSQSLKRPAATLPADDNPDSNVKRSKQEIPRDLPKHMARVCAKRKHKERLEEVGGKGNEHRLRDEIIDLGWTHMHPHVEACYFCFRKASAKKFGMWRCPFGGAVVCKPCLNGFSTFDA